MALEFGVVCQTVEDLIESVAKGSMDESGNEENLERLHLMKFHSFSLFPKILLNQNVEGSKKPGVFLQQCTSATQERVTFWTICFKPQRKLKLGKCHSCKMKS